MQMNARQHLFTRVCGWDMCIFIESGFFDEGSVGASIPLSVD